MRRTTARRAAAWLTAALLAAGCAAGPPHAPPPPRQASGGTVHLRIATGADLTNGGIRKRLIDAWDERHRHVDVQVVELSDDSDRQRSQLAAALQAGNEDAYDIVNLDVTWTAEFADQHLIAPLDDRLTRSLRGQWPQARRTVRYAGRDWAVPWNTDVGLLYYRADLLGAGFHPATWDDLTDAVARFHRSRDKRITAGLITQLASYEGLTVNAYEAAWRHGGSIVDDRRAVRVAEPAARAGLDELAESFKPAGPYDPGSPRLPLLSPDSLSATETTSVEAFMAGETLAMRNWPFALGWLADEQSKQGGKDVRYGVTTLPGGSDGPAAALGGQNLALTATSRHRAAAEDLVAYLTGTAAGRCLRAGGFVPADMKAATGTCDDRLVAPGLPRTATVPAPLLEEYESALKTALAHARARPVTPYYAAVTRDIQEAVHAQLTARQSGRSVPEDATVDALHDRLGEALKGG